MPRDGSNIYHTPPGTQGVPSTTIASTPYNGYLADIEQDLNLPRPIVAGGTGATNADDALFNLHGEEAAQVITNWDSTVFEPGSFYAATTASGTAPVSGHAFAGICYINEALANPPTNQNVVIEARDLTDPNHPAYTRVMAAGVWGAWGLDNASQFVRKAGDTMTGPLTVSPPATGGVTVSPAAGSPTILLSGIAGTTSDVAGAKPAGLRWLARLGDATAEAGGNVGSDFSLMSFTDAGAALDTPLQFTRSTGLGVVKADPTAALGIATKGYVDAGDANAVLYTAQSLTAAQQTQARQNIYAAPFDALAYNGLQINGNMDVSQPNGTTAVSISSAGGGYVLDGWGISSAGAAVVSAQQVTDAPPGYTNSLKVSVTTANAAPAAGDFLQIYQPIEGLRIARLAFGTASAFAVSIGFWIKANRTGVYGGVLKNPAGTRSYPFTFNVTASGTWQFVTLTIPGDAAGAWVNTNAGAMYLNIAMMCGTTYSGPAGAWAGANYVGAIGAINGVAATTDYMQITGVVIVPGLQLPSASRAPFIMRPFDQELITCKRYLQKIGGDASFDFIIGGYIPANGNLVTNCIPYPVEMRAIPAASIVGTLAIANLPNQNLTFYPGLKSIYITPANLAIATAITYLVNQNPPYAYLKLDARL